MNSHQRRKRRRKLDRDVKACVKSIVFPWKQAAIEVKFGPK